MTWLFLTTAGAFETGWFLGMNLSQTQASHELSRIVFPCVILALSGYFLWLARKALPMARYMLPGQAPGPRVLSSAEFLVSNIHQDFSAWPPPFSSFREPSC